jgi:hypothetical protein
MSDKRQDEILQEMDKLVQELKELRLQEKKKQKKGASPCPSFYKDVKGAKSLVGKEVLITVDRNDLKGKIAVVLSPRGKSKKPLYWNLRLVEDGREFYKCRTSFKVIDVAKDAAA